MQTKRVVQIASLAALGAILAVPASAQGAKNPPPAPPSTWNQTVTKEKGVEGQEFDAKQLDIIQKIIVHHQNFVFIDEILRENKMHIHDLDAVAVGKGPGSYTGLRIGVSTAKGLCYGAKIPLIAQNTLKIMVNMVLEMSPKSIRNLPQNKVRYCPMIDARRMEIYTGLFDSLGNETEPVSAKIVDSDTFKRHLENQFVVFFG
jgi:hypothetical protein